MYEVLLAIINKGGFDLSDTLTKINRMWLKGYITEEQCEELESLARGNADPRIGLDVLAAIEQLATDYRTLEARVSALEENPPEPSIEDYVPGKWYYNGDKVRFEGEVYVCIAPEGAVCTWSPREYPAYWEKV